MFQFSRRCEVARFVAETRDKEFPVLARKARAAEGFGFQVQEGVQLVRVAMESQGDVGKGDAGEGMHRRESALPKSLSGVCRGRAHRCRLCCGWSIQSVSGL